MCRFKGMSERTPHALAAVSSYGGPFDAVVFAGGGCRCFWQAGFWSVAAPELSLAPRLVGAASAGAAFACAAVGGVLDRVLHDFKQRVANNARNVYPRNLAGGEPAFPHERIYRATLLENLDDGVLERIRCGPDLRVFLARPPAWLGASSGLAVGLIAYQLDRLLRDQVHPIWGRRLGFQGEVVSARSCANREELADLVLQSSCTPPMTPLYRRDDRVVLDGGVVDGVPVEAVEEAERTLVLLTRAYAPKALPKVPGRIYIAPSRSTPVAKWDYTSPDLVQATWDLGRRDGENFVMQHRNGAHAERLERATERGQPRLAG
jgi:predicted acylesterase/phospholipase RssA